MTVQIRSSLAFAEALERLAAEIRRGNVVSAKAVLEPSGLATCAITFLDGELPECWRDQDGDLSD